MVQLLLYDTVQYSNCFHHVELLNICAKVEVKDNETTIQNMTVHLNYNIVCT